MPEGFAGQFVRFHRALHTGTELPVTVADARAALELITAMYLSARTRAPVELPLPAGHPLYGGWQPVAAPSGPSGTRTAGSADGRPRRRARAARA
jgi:hypothetical protein